MSNRALLYSVANICFFLLIEAFVIKNRVKYMINSWRHRILGVYVGLKRTACYKGLLRQLTGNLMARCRQIAGQIRAKLPNKSAPNCRTNPRQIAEFAEKHVHLILTAAGEYAYRRPEDEVYVVPIGCLKPWGTRAVLRAAEVFLLKLSLL